MKKLLLITACLGSAHIMSMSKPYKNDKVLLYKIKMAVALSTQKGQNPLFDLLNSTESELSRIQQIKGTKAKQNLLSRRISLIIKIIEDPTVYQRFLTHREKSLRKTKKEIVLDNTIYTAMQDANMLIDTVDSTFPLPAWENSSWGMDETVINTLILSTQQAPTINHIFEKVN